MLGGDRRISEPPTVVAKSWGEDDVTGHLDGDPGSRGFIPKTVGCIHWPIEIMVN